MITSVHNPKIQLVRTLLAHAKDRAEAKVFVVEGVRLVEEAAAADWPIRLALFSEDLSPRGQALLDLLRSRRVSCEGVQPGILNSLSETKTSQGILALVEQKPASLTGPLSFVLILDSLRDPGNVGTLLRAGAAAGVQAAFLSPGSADVFSPKVVRAAMGAHFHLPIFELTWEEIAQQLQGLNIFLAEMEGSLPCWEADFKSPLALVIGAEADGASQAARKLANQAVSIPMPGQVESLNAAMAGAILMFEVVRQRGL